MMRMEAVNAVGEFQMDMSLTQQVVARTERDLTWLAKTALTQVAAIPARRRLRSGVTAHTVTSRRG